MGLFDWVDEEDKDEVEKAWEEGLSGSINGWTFSPFSGQYEKDEE